MQHAATHCNFLQHTIARLKRADRIGMIFAAGLFVQIHEIEALQHTAIHCNKLQHTATPCNIPHHPVTPCNTLQHTVARLVRADRIGAVLAVGLAVQIQYEIEA